VDNDKSTADKQRHTFHARLARAIKDTTILILTVTFPCTDGAWQGTIAIRAYIVALVP
jgi:hypothetical protein